MTGWLARQDSWIASTWARHLATIDIGHAASIRTGLLMLRRVISSGQTGVEQAALRAAKAAGLETGGCMRNGWLTEDGPRPDLAVEFGLVVSRSRSLEYVRANVVAADTTLLFLNEDPPVRFGLVARWCIERSKGLIEKSDRLTTPPSLLARHLRLLRVRALNVSGTRESGSRGIGARAEHYLGEVFRLLADE